MKKIMALVLSVTLAMTALVGCGRSKESANRDSTESKGIKVGVSMPTKSLQRWNQDGSNMEASLKAKNYEVDLQFAENEVETQVNQIENMITKGAKILVVASIDGGALSSVLEDAKAEGIKVIAYEMKEY